MADTSPALDHQLLRVRKVAPFRSHQYHTSKLLTAHASLKRKSKHESIAGVHCDGVERRPLDTERAMQSSVLGQPQTIDSYYRHGMRRAA
jgi:hypothetical protein